ncbi:aldehyde dehydrogenase family 2 member B4, mitochondrial-like [Physcomitrium patens]
MAFTRLIEVEKLVIAVVVYNNLKLVILELREKSPIIIYEDANMDKVVELAYFQMFFNHGQCCCAASCIFVHENICNKFIEKSKACTLKCFIGDLFRNGMEQGPQVEKG